MAAAGFRRQVVAGGDDGTGEDIRRNGAGRPASRRVGNLDDASIGGAITPHADIYRMVGGIDGKCFDPVVGGVDRQGLDDRARVDIASHEGRITVEIGIDGEEKSGCRIQTHTRVVLTRITTDIDASLAAAVRIDTPDLVVVGRVGC